MSAQRTFEQAVQPKRVLACAVIMAMTRLGLIAHQEHADSLFADMMQSSVEDLQTARATYEARIAERDKKAKLAGGTGR